jgi:hypothetical protein
MKRGKPWSRGDKIGFGSLVVAIVGLVIALLFPEVRIWLHLEKKPAESPVAAPKVGPLPAESSAAEPTLAPTLTPTTKPTVTQHSKAAVKGDRNVAGNNAAGNGNMVGNNNPVAVAPNGIANAAPNFGNQTVNNLGPPDPKISYMLVDGPALENVKNPHACVKITIDRMMEDPKFGVVCDRGCKSVFGQLILPPNGGESQTGLAVAPESPNIALFIVYRPNPMPSDYGCLVCVESMNEDPVRIRGVGKAILPKP